MSHELASAWQVRYNYSEHWGLFEWWMKGLVRYTTYYYWKLQTTTTECERDRNLVRASKIILVIARLLLDCFSGFHLGYVSWYCETISDTKSYDGPWLYKWFMHLYAVVAPWVQLFSSWLRLWWRFSLITNCVFFHTLGRHRFAMSLNFAVSMVWLLVPWDNINDYIYLWFFPCYVACQ